MRIGAQFYTLRDYCKTLDDFSVSLRKIADMGYEYVQISGTCPYEGDWLNENLRAAGLKCVITHNSAVDIQNDPAALAEKHEKFGCKYIGLGSFGFGVEKDSTVEDFENIYGPAMKIFKEKGKYFMYHNHAHEFRREEGQLVLERMAERIPAEYMGFTLDTYWVQVGGGDPAQWIERFAGRVPCIHLKDYAFGQKMAVVGEGNLNFERIFEKAEAAGTEYMLVEQDDCNGEDPFDCLRRSYEYLKSCGFR